MSLRKVKVPLSKACRLLHPRHTVLVTCGDREDRFNVMAASWSMPVSRNPPMVAVSVAPRRYSYKLIKKSREFVLNIPSMKLLKETLFCGRVSGRECDKFERSGLTPIAARRVKSPAVKECVAHLECKVEHQLEAGDHTLFIGRVLEAYADEGVLTEDTVDIKKAKPIYHIGGDDFTELKSEVMRPEIQNTRRRRQ